MPTTASQPDITPAPNLPALLTVEQQQRVIALKEARQVLEARRSGAPLGGSTSDPPTCDDLLAVADYIVNDTMWLEDGQKSDGVKVLKDRENAI